LADLDDTTCGVSCHSGSPLGVELFLRDRRRNRKTKSNTFLPLNELKTLPSSQHLLSPLSHIYSSTQLHTHKPHCRSLRYRPPKHPKPHTVDHSCPLHPHPRQPPHNGLLQPFLLILILPASSPILHRSQTTHHASAPARSLSPTSQGPNRSMFLPPSLPNPHPHPHVLPSYLQTNPLTLPFLESKHPLLHRLRPLPRPVPLRQGGKMLHAVHGEVHAGVERGVPELHQQAAEGEGEYGDCGAQRRRGIVFVGG
jgi:hypothetical protein